jgi:hypothetical protein
VAPSALVVGVSTGGDGDGSWLGIADVVGSIGTLAVGVGVGVTGVDTG